MGKRRPFLGYPSVATYIRTCLEQDPPLSRVAIMAPLIAEGYTLLQAQNLYNMVVTRYRNQRMEQLRKEGVVVG